MIVRSGRTVALVLIVKFGFGVFGHGENRTNGEGVFGNFVVTVVVIEFSTDIGREGVGAYRKVALQVDAVSITPGKGLGLNIAKVDPITVTQKDRPGQVETAGRLGNDPILRGAVSAQIGHIAVADAERKVLVLTGVLSVKPRPQNWLNEEIEIGSELPLNIMRILIPTECADEEEPRCGIDIYVRVDFWPEHRLILRTQRRHAKEQK